MADEPVDQLVPKQSPGRIAIQLIGFAVGAALLGWCVYVAATQGDWSRLRNAGVGPVALLVSCTVVSMLVNGTTFWVTVQPMRSLTWRDLMLLNMLANLLNYAPLRLGAIARIAYHVRIDRLPLLAIGAWFTCITWFLALGIGSCAAATIVRPQLDFLWVLLLIGQLALGGALTRVIAGSRILEQLGQGAHSILRSPVAIWSAIGLRMLDIAAYIGRMTAALWIVGLSMPASHIVLLALVAATANLIPFGRLGFREMAVTIVALRLNAIGMDSSAIESVNEGTWAQLALIESAGEAIVAIPAGLVAVPWFRKKWRNRNHTNAAA